MKKNFYSAIALLLLFMSQSCSTVNITSNKQQDYHKQLKKIYIVINYEKGTSTFCNGLLNGLKNKLKEKGVQVESRSRDQLSLETEDELAKRVDAFNPEAVLMIQQTLTGGESQSTFELTLIDKETKKRVWKALFDITADSYSSIQDDGAINKSVKAILEKLTQDKII